MQRYPRNCKVKGCREKATQSGYCSSHSAQIQLKAIEALSNNHQIKKQ